LFFGLIFQPKRFEKCGIQSVSKFLDFISLHFSELMFYMTCHRSAESFALVGHSTGCQNSIHFLKVRVFVWKEHKSCSALDVYFFRQKGPPGVSCIGLAILLTLYFFVSFCQLFLCQYGKEEMIERTKVK
jgi:hypothetical protein